MTVCEIIEDGTAFELCVDHAVEAIRIRDDVVLTATVELDCDFCAVDAKAYGVKVLLTLPPRVPLI